MKLTSLKCHKSTFSPQAQGPLCLILSISQGSVSDSVALCAEPLILQESASTIFPCLHNLLREIKILFLSEGWISKEKKSKNKTRIILAADINYYVDTC